VVGDIHGAYDLLLDGLKAVAFDFSRDRLFSVGDLIDRGPQSWRAARFLSKPYVFAVRGNHEQDLIDLYEDGAPDEAVIQALGRSNFNGCGWLATATPQQRWAVVEAARTLPIAIEIETERGTVGLVHADVPQKMDWNTFIRAIEANDTSVISTALLGRRRLSREDHTGVAGIGRLFVGHTVQWEGARRFGNVYAIDTGAVFAELDHPRGGVLSIVSPIAATLAITSDRPRDGVCAVASAQAIEVRPFGHYVS
jgi:serine/threonine protein phosphatase 1